MDLIISALFGLVAAGLGVFFTRPAAAAAVAEQRLKLQARRHRIADGRELLAEAATSGWQVGAVGADRRFMALRRHLPRDLVDEYAPEVSGQDLSATAWLHEDLARAIDRLEEDWELI
jgi:hypothetical protein